MRQASKTVKRISAAAPAAKPPRKKPGPKVPEGLRTDVADQLKSEYEAKKNSYSMTEVCELLGISTLTASRWMKEGRFVGVKWIGTRWLFDPDFKIKEPRRATQRWAVIQRIIPDDGKR